MFVMSKVTDSLNVIGSSAESLENGLDIGSILSHTITLILFFLLCSAMAMIVAYISELHSKMATTIVQNQRLLNGMHEGLLIISNSN